MNLTKLTMVIQMVQTIMKSARDNFDRDGHLTTCAFLFGTKYDPETGKKLDKPGFNIVGVESQANSAEKDAFAEKLGELTRKTQAAGIGYMAEAWTAHVPMHMRHLVGTVPVSELPGAMEVAYFTLEHRELRGKTRTWCAKINRPASGKPILGPFELMTDDNVNYGRFSHFLGDI